jgi:hypothetical protein
MEMITGTGCEHGFAIPRQNYRIPVFPQAGEPGSTDCQPVRREEWAFLANQPL